MTHALTAVGTPALSTSVQAAHPVVMLGGVPDPALLVARFDASAPFDDRSATIGHSGVHAEPWDRLARQAINILIPHRLRDGDTRWDVLLSGRADESIQELAGGPAGRSVLVRDQLARLLDEPVSVLGVTGPTARTLGELLARLADALLAEIAWLSTADAQAIEIVMNDPDATTVRGALSPAFDSAGLMLAQSFTFQRGVLARSLAVRPARSGRWCALPWPDRAGHAGYVLSVGSTQGAQAPRQWIGLGARPVVEDTFALQPAWDPALADQPDTAYGRLTSADFSRYGPVFRAWVLNEDGAYSESPYAAGPAFDAGALFDTPGGITEPRPLGDCLTHDPSGRRITPVVESSTDGGTNWARYPGTASIMADRAGVLLADDTLPNAVLAAAQAGMLRVRVTATLTAPEPIQARRWDGNPFAGSGPTRRITLGDSYRWRRVAATSIHAASIAAGELTADTADDRAALRAELLARIHAAPATNASATAELAGAWTAIRAGDRVRDVLSPGVAIDGVSSRFDTPGARVRSTRITFARDRAPARTRLRID